MSDAKLRAEPSCGVADNSISVSERPASFSASGSLRRTDVQEPLNAVVTRAYGFSFVLPYLFYSFRLSFQIILERFPKTYYPSTIMSSLVTKWKKNKPYLYWVRSARVEGKPRIVEQLYLGPRER